MFIPALLKPWHQLKIGNRIVVMWVCVWSMPKADLVAPNRVEWLKFVTRASVCTYLCTFTDIVSSDYCMSVFGERRNREKGLRSAMKAKRQRRKERPTPKLLLHLRILPTLRQTLWIQDWPLQPFESPQNNLFQQQEDNHRNHRNNSPLPRLSNSPVPLSIPHSAHCALNRPSGNSKTNNIPILCRPNKSVSEYLPDTPALLIQSQRYVTASNSRQNS